MELESDEGPVPPFVKLIFLIFDHMTIDQLMQKAVVLTTEHPSFTKAL